MKQKNKDLSIKKPKNNSNKVTVNVTNELSIYNIESIKKEIDQLIETYEILDISINNLNNMDLSGIQYIHAVKKEVQQKGKEINFSFELNEELTNLIVKCGFSELIKN